MELRGALHAKNDLIDTQLIIHLITGKHISHDERHPLKGRCLSCRYDHRGGPQESWPWQEVALVLRTSPDPSCRELLQENPRGTHPDPAHVLMENFMGSSTEASHHAHLCQRDPFCRVWHGSKML